jgi:Arc/MetJ-type ribon-helix-helix transcriptional regulator
MARFATIDVSLTAKELKLVREQVKRGAYVSESDVLREGLKRIFQQTGVRPVHKSRSDSQRLAAAYRATSARDRKLAGEWSSLNDPWPNC